MSGRGAERILELVEWLSRRWQPVSLAEITQAMAMPKSSTLMLMRTLVSRGYALRDQDGLYRLLRIPGEPVANDTAWGTVLRMVEPILRAAVVEADESGFLAVLQGSEIRYLNKVLPDREIRYDRDITKARRPHEVASGIVILAGLPEDERTRLLTGLEADQRRIIQTDIERAKAQQAFANLNGIVEGAAGIAAPVLARDGSILAAINIAGPRERIAADQDRLTAITIAAAAQASALIARTGPYRPTPPTLEKDT